MWVMTFHSSCARMLRSDAERLGYTRGFTIYDEADSVRLVKRCIEELGVDPKRFPPRGIKRQISDAKNQLLDAEAYRLKVDSYFEQTAADVYERYEQQIHSMNAMDFDDLLFRCVNLFELFPEVLDRYRRAFRHVLVDEYQDTNHAQYRWLRLLAEEHRNLAWSATTRSRSMRFRGADIRNVLGFEDDFPDATTIKLEQNYRSTQTILDAANAIIANNRSQKPKHLWTDRGPGRARSTCASSRTSTPRPASWRARSSATWRAAAPATTSPSSTAPTPRAGCSRTRSCATASATRSSAAPASTSAPRSRTRSPTSRCWSTRTTWCRSAGSSTRRGGGSATRRRRGSSPTPTRSASRSSTWRCTPRRCPAWAPPR